MTEIQLPKAECRYGYTTDQVKEIVGDRLAEFQDYMKGQTQTLCSGSGYNHETKKYYATGCGPHGCVTYGIDIWRFLHNRPPLD